MLPTAVYTDIGGRAVNEDCARYVETGGGALCLAVCDGLGGHGGGSVASRTAAELVCSLYAEGADLAALTQEAHRAVRARQSGGCAMMSTIALLAVEGRLARWAHVGDTRLYRFLDGKLVFQSRDHSASQAAVLLGEITPEQIRFHPSRSRVLRALGQEGELRVEQGSARLEAGQNAFLLCTDGFWEYVYENEMAETLRRSSSPQEWLERMRRYIAARAPRDNDNNTAAAVWA